MYNVFSEVNNIKMTNHIYIYIYNKLFVICNYKIYFGLDNGFDGYFKKK